jgi:hypothetical protein
VSPPPSALGAMILESIKLLKTPCSLDSDLTRDLIDYLIDHLATFLRCLRITCGDLRTTNNASVGLSKNVPEICSKIGQDNQLPIAGYENPGSDANESARLDLDVAFFKLKYS